MVVLGLILMAIGIAAGTILWPKEGDSVAKRLIAYLAGGGVLGAGIALLILGF